MLKRAVTLLGWCVLAGCQPSVAHVEFAVAVVEVRDRAGTPLPLPRCTSSNGKQLPLPLDAAWAVEPPTLADIRDGRVIPRESGEGALVVSLERGKARARLPLLVALVDTVRVRCAEPSCQVRPGQTLRMRATALSRGVPMAGVAVRWTSSKPAVATVDEDGVVTAVAPGNTAVQALAGDVPTSTRVTVVPAPDEIVIICPNPPFSVAAQHPLGMRGTSAACITAMERPTRLLGQLRAGGVVVPSSDVTWRSLNEKIALVTGGVVTGLSKGTTLVEARAGELAVSMPISVLPQVAADGLPTECVEEHGPERALKLVTNNRITFAVRCPGPASERCLRGLTRQGTDENLLYVALDRCCCHLSGGDAEGDLGGE
jgi:hypothetical protein